jgi:uncharacterized protein
MQLQSPSPAAGPVPQSNRIQSIDLLRGVAVLGILLVNIVGFGIVTGGNFGDRLYADTSHPNFLTYAAVYIFAEGKMRALFCMLFGAGILLFSINKTALEPKRITFLFYIRMCWLIVFGLINAHLLLWVGDVLFFYGLFGMIVYLFRKMKPVHMLMFIPLVVIIGFVMGSILYRDVREKRFAFNAAEQLQKAGQALTVQQQAAISNWREVEQTMLPNEADAQEQAEKMRSGYEVVASTIRPKAFKAQTKYILVEFGDQLALMLLGMALLKWGFFTGEWTSRQYRFVMLIGYGIGLPLVAYDFWLTVNYTHNMTAVVQQLERTSLPWKMLLYPIQRMLLVMAHCAALLLLFRTGWLTAMFNRLRAVGQMALTNYLVQTILCSLFFFGYGLGYYNRLEVYQLYFLVAAIWALQLFYSPLWLKYYPYGPMEWLWRRLTYKKGMIRFQRRLMARLSEVKVVNR